MPSLKKSGEHLVPVLVAGDGKTTTRKRVTSIDPNQPEHRYGSGSYGLLPHVAAVVSDMTDHNIRRTMRDGGTITMPADRSASS